MTGPALTEHEAAAVDAGLIYVSDASPGIRRRRSGRGFTYLDPNGKTIHDPELLKRIRGLVIPPAWTEVWICPDRRGHIQVTARDARGRKQYRYHPRYRAVRDETKFERIFEFSEVLPDLRKQVESHLKIEGHKRERVLALVVRLLEKTLIRIGNDEYARQNRSYGLTTLRQRHVEVDGHELRFEFRGKSGVRHDVTLTDKRLARIVQHCQELPGEELFQYIDDDGRRRSVDSGDINEYLRTLAKGKEITAKDFRTWMGTMLAAKELRGLGKPASEREARSNIVLAVDRVAKRLGNTRAVCRKYYIHPTIFEAYLKGETVPAPVPGEGTRHVEPGMPMLRQDEAIVLEFLRTHQRD